MKIIWGLKISVVDVVERLEAIDVANQLGVDKVERLIDEVGVERDRDHLRLLLLKMMLLLLKLLELMLVLLLELMLLLELLLLLKMLLKLKLLLLLDLLVQLLLGDRNGQRHIELHGEGRGDVAVAKTVQNDVVSVDVRTIRRHLIRNHLHGNVFKRNILS